MSKLEELIEELCPDGVEYKKVKEVFTRIKGTPITAGKMKEIASDDGDVRVFAGGKTVIDAFEKDIPNANITRVPSVLVQSRGVIDVVFYEKPFTFKNEMWAYTHKERTMVKFLYYVLKDNVQVFRDAASGMGSLPQISLPVTEDFIIPIPPLPVQEEIVRILDNFTDLTAELQARTKQYEYYKHHLLMDNGEKCLLSDVASYSRDRIDAKELNEDTYVGVDNLLQECAGKTLSTHVPEDGRLTKYKENDILIGNIRPYLKKIWFSNNVGGTNGDVLVIKVNDIQKVYPRFLYYILSSSEFFAYDMNYSKGAKMPRGDKDAIMKYPLSIPSLEEQERIVAILDNFDSLTTDISIGLPAEIEARQKQYEYYRDKLLSFKELNA